MKNIKLNIKTKSKIYPIYLGSNLLNKTGKLIKKNLPNVKKVCIISDKKIPKKLLSKLIASLGEYDVKLFCPHCPLSFHPHDQDVKGPAGSFFISSHA